MEREGGYGDHDAIVSLRLMCLLKTGPKLFFIVPRAIQADPQAPRSNVNTLGSVVATVPKKRTDAHIFMPSTMLHNENTTSRFCI